MPRDRGESRGGLAVLGCPVLGSAGQSPSELEALNWADRALLGERHLRIMMAEYEAHYNGRRPHRSRQLHPPRPDHPAADLSQERIRRRPVLGGLINEYERAA